MSPGFGPVSHEGSRRGSGSGGTAAQGRLLAFVIGLSLVFGCGSQPKAAKPRDVDIQLAKAVMEGDVELVRSALIKGANPNFIYNKRPVILLIDQAPPTIGISWISRDGSGGSFVHFKNHKNIIKLLIDKGANLNVVDYRGWTPLKQAEERSNDKDIVDILRKNGEKE